MNFEYQIQIGWSAEDSAYIAVVPDLPGCMADGETPEEALANARHIIQEWIEVAKQEKRRVPPPLSIQDIGKQEQIRFKREFERAVRETMPEFIDQLKEQIQAQSAARNPRTRGFPCDDSETVKSAG